MDRSWLHVLSTVAILLGIMTACASPAAPSPTAVPATPAAPTAMPATSAAPTAAPAPAPTIASAASAETIKFGFITGLTGPYAVVAQDQIRGAQLAIDDANGQVIGRKIELIQRDDKLNTQEAAVQAQQLVQNEKVNLIMGCVSAATTLAVNEITKRAEALYLGPCLTNNLNKMPDFSPYTFHIALTPYQMTQAATPWLVQNVGKKWYFLMADYAAGKEFYEGFGKALKASGGTELGVTWTPLGTSDFNSQIPKIMDAKPEVLITLLAGTDLTAFMKQARGFGLDKQTKLVGPVVDLPVEMELGFGYIAGTYALAPFYWELADKVPSAKRFVDAYQAKYGMPPSGYSAYGYDTTRVLIDGIAKAGSADPKKVASALEGYKYDYTRGSEWLRKCDHQNMQPILVLKGRTAEEAAAVKKDKYGFREIVATVDAADANERSCQELGLADRQ